MFPFSVNVAYQLREYLSVVTDFASTARPSASFGPIAKFGIAMIAVPIFYYKIMRVGRCKFTFTESGLTRDSKIGMLEVPWQDVRQIYTLSHAFLIAKASGAMPVPYRCLSNSERELLTNFFAQLNSERGVA